MAGSAAQQRNELRRVRGVGVFAFDEGIFEDITAARLFKIIVAGAQNFGNGIRLGDGHDAGALGVVRGMQRHGEVDGDALLRQGAHLRHQPAGGEADVAGADIDAPGGGDVLQKADGVGVIVQRFAAAHQHDVGDGALFRRAAAAGVDGEDLAQNFAGGEVAHQPVQPRSAEGAVHAAAHLGRHALRSAIFIAHQHPFDDVAVRQGEEVFFGAVGRGVDLGDAHGLVFKPLQQFLLQGGGELGDVCNFFAAHEAAIQLPGAVFLFAQLCHQLLYFGKGKILQDLLHDDTFRKCAM